MTDAVGMDAMLDDVGNAWLLEVNARPSLGGKASNLKTKLLEAVLERVLAGAQNSHSTCDKGSVDAAAHLQLLPELSYTVAH